MPIARLSVSLSQELAKAIRALAARRREEVSRLLEVLLREHAMVRAEMESLRSPQGPPPLKKGRDLDKLLVLAEASRARWRTRLRSGQVQIRDA